MQKHCRRMSAYLLSAGAAAVFGVFSAQAATLGHSRVTSLPQQPLRIVVQIKDLSPAERQSLSVQVAPAAAWQEVGLTPPVVLDSLSAQLVVGVTPNNMQLVLQSAQVAQDSVLDVLVDVKTASSTQRHQVSVLQAQQATPISLAHSSTDATVPVQTTRMATPGTPSQTTAVTGDQQIRVRKGQYLYKIARQLRSDQYNDQQMMAALLQANPDAFIQGNMNLLRAGATLQVPDAATVASISPQQARQLYQKHLEWFDEYRQRIAKGQGAMPLPAPTMSSMTTEATPLEAQKTDADQAQTPSSTTDPISSSTDRLQLSAQTDEQAKADQAVATAQDLAYTAERLAQLEGTASAGGQQAGGATTSSLKAESNEQANAELATNTVSPEGASATTAAGQGMAATQANNSAGTNVADSSDSSTSPVAAGATTAESTSSMAERTSSTTEGASPTADSTSSTAESTSWIQDNFLRFILGGLLLVVLFVTWFLRRGQSSRLAYAESVPDELSRGREKRESTSTDEVEFREKN